MEQATYSLTRIFWGLILKPRRNLERVYTAELHGHIYILERPFQGILLDVGKAGKQSARDNCRIPWKTKQGLFKIINPDDGMSNTYQKLRQLIVLS